VIEFLNILVSLLPVLVFLVALVFLDSFKLVSLRSVLQAILAGALVAVACYFLSGVLLDALPVSHLQYKRYIAPVVEELLKSLYVVFLIRTMRTGFIVDAAIYAFAVGAGFALVENAYYLQELQSGQIITWVVRGFGTAIMHGSTMAIFGILAKGASDRHASMAPVVFLPGLLVAIVIHSLYNHFLVNPVASAALLLAVLPFLVIFVFDRSERATRRWLGVGFDSDVELLEIIHTGAVTETHVGEYLESLKAAFPGEVVGDMLCLLQIHLELSIRAKGVLMAREAGIQLPVDETVKANLDELKYLEKSVGKTGKLAMTPFLNMTSRDLWQLYMLGK
jgi:RsiW-degrading membrane proteinase PrsW (M82 family)